MAFCHPFQPTGESRSCSRDDLLRLRTTLRGSCRMCSYPGSTPPEYRQASSSIESWARNQYEYCNGFGRPVWLHQFDASVRLLVRVDRDS